MNHKFFWLFSLVLIIFSGCEDDNTEEIIANERRKFENYLLENGITIQPEESGLYYLEQSPGNGPSPVPGDYLDLLYTIRLVNGQVIDTNIKSVAIQNGIYRQNVFYGASRLQAENIFEGMSEGVQLMKEGGTARILVPPELGFGKFSSSLVPSYSSLILDMELLTVIKDPGTYQEEVITNYIADSNYIATETSSGLYYIEVEEGKGNPPVAADSVSVDLLGYFIDGRVFMDSEPGDPYKFAYDSGGVIQGLDEGVSMMKKGGKSILIIPYQLGYGSVGRGTIPPYMPLVFEVEVINIE